MCCGLHVAQPRPNFNLLLIVRVPILHTITQAVLYIVQCHIPLFVAITQAVLCKIGTRTINSKLKFGRGKAMCTVALNSSNYLWRLFSSVSNNTSQSQQMNIKQFQKKYEKDKILSMEDRLKTSADAVQLLETIISFKK